MNFKLVVASLAALSAVNALPVDSVIQQDSPISASGSYRPPVIKPVKTFKEYKNVVFIPKSSPVYTTTGNTGNNGNPDSSDFEFEFGVKTAADCRKLCASRKDCKWSTFSWKTEFGLCITFKLDFEKTPKDRFDEKGAVTFVKARKL